MAKEEEEKAGIIPKADYDERLETEVAYHVARINAGNPFRVTKKYSHIEIPDFGSKDYSDKRNWEMEEIRRCLEGYDGMVGRYYFYFNHARIKHKSRGKIRPDFRATQMHFSAAKDRIIKTPGKGLVMIKRRQVGMSWDFSGDNIYDATFNNDFDIGMSSKSENDSRNLFVKHKYIHRNLQPFLKAKVSIDRRDAMIFSEYDKKTNKTTGTGSSIISVAPTPTSHAGNQYRKLVLDESGEVVDLMPMWANAEDTLMQETERVGTPFIFGTMGDVDRAGAGLMEFWLKNDLYNLERYPIWGYNCLLMDDLGNDDIEESVRWILYTRKRKEGGSQIIYNKFVQKYPLDEDDAFLNVNGSGVGNPQLLQKQFKKLTEYPAQQVCGWMRAKVGGGADFVPDPQGKIIIYERPMDLVHGYLSSVDPAEDDDIKKSRDTSNLGTNIMSKPFGVNPPKIVAEFVDRPPKLATYYEQLALLLTWYNKTKVLIEMNKGGWRMKEWFELYYPHLLSLTPKNLNSVKIGFESTVGIKMTPERKIQMKGLLDGYWESYWEYIPSLRFIKECKVFGADHADDDFATSVGWSLIMLQSDKRVAHHLDETKKLLPVTTYKKQGNTIQMLTRGEALKGNIRKINNPLFNR